MFLDDSVDAFDRSIHPLGLDMRGHQVRRRGFEHLDATTVLVQRRNLFRQHAEGRPGNQMLIVFQGHQQNLAAFRQHMQHGPQFGHGARMPTRPVHPGQTPRRPRSDHRRSAQKSHHNIKCWSALRISSANLVPYEQSPRYPLRNRLSMRCRPDRYHARDDLVFPTNACLAAHGYKYLRRGR